LEKRKLFGDYAWAEKGSHFSRPGSHADACRADWLLKAKNILLRNKRKEKKSKNRRKAKAAGQREKGIGAPENAQKKISSEEETLEKVIGGKRSKGVDM